MSYFQNRSFSVQSNTSFNRKSVNNSRFFNKVIERNTSRDNEGRGSSFTSGSSLPFIKNSRSRSSFSPNINIRDNNSFKKRTEKQIFKPTFLKKTTLMELPVRYNRYYYNNRNNNDRYGSSLNERDQMNTYGNGYYNNNQMDNSQSYQSNYYSQNNNSSFGSNNYNNYDNSYYNNGGANNNQGYADNYSQMNNNNSSFGGNDYNNYDNGYYNNTGANNNQGYTDNNYPQNNNNSSFGGNGYNNYDNGYYNNTGMNSNQGYADNNYPQMNNNHDDEYRRKRDEGMMNGLSFRDDLSLDYFTKNRDFSNYRDTSFSRRFPMNRFDDNCLDNLLPRNPRNLYEESDYFNEARSNVLRSRMDNERRNSFDNGLSRNITISYLRGNDYNNYDDFGYADTRYSNNRRDSYCDESNFFPPRNMREQERRVNNNYYEDDYRNEDMYYSNSRRNTFTPRNIHSLNANNQQSLDGYSNQEFSNNSRPRVFEEKIPFYICIKGRY